MRHSAIHCSLIWAIWMALSTACHAEIVIGEVRWGFDQQVRIGQFNLLSISLLNDSDQPWQGDVILRQKSFDASKFVPIMQPQVRLKPREQRLLQLQILVSQRGDYELSWGSGLDASATSLLEMPKLAAQPAEIILSADAVPLVTETRKALKPFPAIDFPPFAAGLESLRAVHLGHVPDWNVAQQQAFLDWLSAGGTMYLYQTKDQQAPAFTGKLTPLNAIASRFNVQGGVVIRHATDIGQAKLQRRTGGQPTIDSGLATPNELIFQRLKAITEPRHNWTAIFSFAVVYVLLLFPGAWLLSRKRGDYRLTTAALVGVVAVFSVGFQTLGARGFGEQAAIDSVAIARPAGSNRLLTTQWSNLFVTSGGQQEITPPTSETFYAVADTRDGATGLIMTPPYSSIVTELPAYSSRGFSSCGMLDSKFQSPEIQRGADGRFKFTFPDDSLWQHDPQTRAELLIGGTMTSLEFDGKSLKQTEDETTLLAFVQSYDQTYQSRVDRDAIARNNHFGETFPLLVAQDVGIQRMPAPAAPQLPDGEGRLYVFTSMPPAFHSVGGRLPKQFGQVLYVFPFHFDPAEKLP